MPAWSPSTARRCRSPRATSSSSRGCASTAATRWRSGWHCCATTTEATGSGAPPTSRPPSRCSRTSASPPGSGPAPRPRRSSRRCWPPWPRTSTPRPPLTHSPPGPLTRSPTPPSPARATRSGCWRMLRLAWSSEPRPRAARTPRSRGIQTPALPLVHVPTLEIPLELLGDRLTAGLGELGGVLVLLEHPDVLPDVLVLLGQLRDAALPGARVLGQVAHRDADLEQVLHVAEERERRLRTWGLRKVVGYGGPERHGRHVHLHAGVEQDTDDPGRALVRRLLQLEPVLEVELGRGSADLDRPRVRGLGQERPKGQHQLDAQRVHRRQHLRCELAPAHAGFHAPQQHDVSVRTWRPGDQDLGAGPRDPAHATGVGADQRPVDLVVVEVLGVDARHPPGIPDVHQVLDQTAGGLGRVVPALERRDQHRADQLRGLLELDHRSTLGRRGPTPPERTQVRRGRATSVPLTHVPIAVPTREEPGDRRVPA